MKYLLEWDLAGEFFFGGSALMIYILIISLGTLGLRELHMGNVLNTQMNFSGYFVLRKTIDIK